MTESKTTEEVSVLDSETSLDYYVTTVNNKVSKKSDLSNKPTEDPTPIVVSVDRAGSVKVRKRKKSKRRKKKSNLALEESGFRVSDDGILYQSSGSDGSHKKVPRRSSSLCERDLRTNSKVLFAELLNQKTAINGHGSLNGQAFTDAVIRRRVKKKTSFQNNRCGMILDNTENINPLFTGMNEEKKSISQQNSLSSVTVSEPNNESESQPTKRLNRQDALATLNAFMMEVEEATTVAKQQEGERKRDPVIRRSHSLSELFAEDTDGSSFDTSDFLPPPPEPVTTSVLHPPSKLIPYTHQKSESIGQRSAVSGSVFMSDQDASIEEAKDLGLHPVLTKSSSDEKYSDRRSKSLYDLVMNTDANVLTEMMYSKVSRNQFASAKPRSADSQVNLNKRKDFDYGIAHLEQVCKLMEQIGDLRTRNKFLEQRVHELETQIKELKDSRGNLAESTSSVDLNSNSSWSKRSRPVERIKGAIARSRKSSVEKPPSAYENKLFNNPSLIVNELDESLPLAASFKPGFGVTELDRPIIISNISLKKNKRRLYSRDDLDLSSKGRWKFWKAPTRSVDSSDPSKKRVVTSIKAENTQGSAVHLKSASVTLDSLLNNLDNNFSQKMLEWQSSSRPSRAPSRASEIDPGTLIRTNKSTSTTALSTLNDENMRFKVHRLSTDGKSGANRKESFRQKLSKWERVAAKKFSLDKRSKSVDRMNIPPPDVSNESELSHHRSLSAGADFHKSLPCVMTASSESRLKHLKRASVHDSVGSMEWSGLQEAFPTTQTRGKAMQRLLGGSQSRLLSGSQSRLASPLRKKNSHKRRSWSFAKRTSSKYYLPSSGDFSLGSNLELAESIGEQLTLELDQEDVKGITAGVNDEELDHLKKNTADLREKLSVIEKEWPTEPMQPQVRQRPASSMARYAEINARSFRRSKHVEILRLSSCEVLTAASTMSPLVEERETSMMCQSLPDLCKSDSDMSSFEKHEPTENSRRYTVTVVDLKRRGSAMSFSAPSLLGYEAEADNLPATQSPWSTLSRIKPNKSVVGKNGDASRKTWTTSTLLNRRRRGFEETLSDADFAEYLKTSTLPRREGAKAIKKRKSIAIKMKDRFQRMSPKPRRAFPGDPSAPQSPKSPVLPKKKMNRIFSFRSKAPVHKTKYSTETGKAKISPLDGNPSDRGINRKKSQKIAEISIRFTEEDSSASRRNSSSPPPISKGLVSRLSKRFSRNDKERIKKRLTDAGAEPSNDATSFDTTSKFESNSQSNPKTSPSGNESNKKSTKTNTLK